MSYRISRCPVCRRRSLLFTDLVAHGLEHDDSEWRSIGVRPSIFNSSFVEDLRDWRIYHDRIKRGDNVLNGLQGSLIEHVQSTFIPTGVA